MDTLTVAYGIVWITVALYVGWLGIQQRRLGRRLAELESGTKQDHHDDASVRGASRAA